MSKLKKRLIIFGSLLIVIVAAVLIWMKQPVDVSPEDIKKGDEIANDDDLLDAIDNGMNESTDTTMLSTDSL